MIWSEYFSYDKTSPSSLRWIVTRYKGRGYKQVAVLKGAVAGSLHTDQNGSKYWKVKLDSKQYSVHRVIYEMFHGEIVQSNEVDHINGVSTDNSIENLREVIKTLNSRNRKALIGGGKTGINGVMIRG